MKTDNQELLLAQEADSNCLTLQERTLWFKAVNAFQIGNAGYTIQLMQKLVKEHPEFLTGRRLLRKAGIFQSAQQKNGIRQIFYSVFFLFKVQSKKNPYVVLETLEKALAQDPYHRRINWLLYTTALACNMPETAAFALETLLEGHPQDIKGMRELAKHYIRYHRPQKALEIYNKILELQPTDFIAIQARRDAIAQVSIQEGKWNSF